jgi:hypothetical protein
LISLGKLKEFETEPIGRKVLNSDFDSVPLVKIAKGRFNKGWNALIVNRVVFFGVKLHDQVVCSYVIGIWVEI